jgi:hypothetical protein
LSAGFAVQARNQGAAFEQGGTTTLQHSAQRGRVRNWIKVKNPASWAMLRTVEDEAKTPAETTNARPAPVFRFARVGR